MSMIDVNVIIIEIRNIYDLYGNYAEFLFASFNSLSFQARI
jgi:hypothetical protein